MAKFLRLSGGIPRSFEETGGSSVTIYDENVTVVSGTPADDTEIQGPVTTGADITLPSSKTYDSDELEVYLNGQRAGTLSDYNYVGAAPNRTAIEFTFDLIVGDVIRFRIDRPAD